VKIVTVVGARPQFVKASPLSRELRHRHREVLVHTGQHYDHGMSERFFDELGLPAPDYHLGVGSGPHGAQTGAMLAAVEAVLERERPAAVVVYGDTNSTLAGALAAAKLRIPIAHVEAGLRSFSRAMPEEINRVVTDHLSQWLFAPSDHAAGQLAREGITAGVHVVGDIMVDALELHRERAAARTRVLEELGLVADGYYLATVHRAENADDPDRLGRILTALGRLGRPVVLPIHPRTRKNVARLALPMGENLRVVEPRGYLDMLALQAHAACVLTDSGGIQKEAYCLRVPCVTLRSETEWVETVATGWNVLAGTDPERIVTAVRSRPGGDREHPRLYGDGTAARRIVEILSAFAGEGTR
jgi:UDP-N-acetylglucosamine 2-epimerase